MKICVIVNFMMTFKSFCLHLRGLSYRIMKFPRKWYHAIKARRNKNLTATIICNNCTAGFMLHDLSMKFRTPTINTLFYSFEDFFLFVNHLKEFQNAQIKEINSPYSYPVGLLQTECEGVKIGFVHYSSYKEAVKAWKERFSRVNFSNLYVIYEGIDISETQVDKLANLSYRKAILSSKNEELERRYPFYHGFSFYSKWRPGLIGDYKYWLSVRRNLDDFDYIAFLNE